MSRTPGNRQPERPCTVVVSSYSGQSDGVSIRVEDEVSHVVMLEIRLTHEQWGRASTSQFAKAVYTAGDQKYWGATSENTSTEVTLSEDVVMRIRNSEDRSTILRLADKGAHQMFADGWTPRWSDIGNMHCRLNRNDDDTSTYRVVWFRHVDPETGEPAR